MDIKHFFTIAILLFSFRGEASSKYIVNMNSFSIDLINYTNLGALRDFKIRLYLDCSYNVVPRPWPEQCGKEEEIDFTTTVSTDGLRLTTEFKSYEYIRGKKDKIRINFCIDHQGVSSESRYRCLNLNLKNYKKALSKIRYFAPSSVPLTITPTINNSSLADWSKSNPSKVFSTEITLLNNRGRKNYLSGSNFYTSLGNNSFTNKFTLFPYSKKNYFLLAGDFVKNDKVRLRLRAFVLKYRKETNGSWTFVKKKRVVSKEYRVDSNFSEVPGAIRNLQVKYRR